MDSLFTNPAVVFTDIDESKNRLTVGVEDLAKEPSVRAELDTLGIPQAAVNIEQEGRPVLLTDPPPAQDNTLRSRVRPLAGGLRIFDNTPNKTQDRFCTLGFIARDSAGKTGFVTAAHCTPMSFDSPTKAGATRSEMFQPKAGADKVGEENLDPALRACTPKPGNNCRTSDSAFIEIVGPVTSALGKIKRPIAPNDPPAQDPRLQDQNPKFVGGDFVIVDTSNFPMMDQPISKVGERTGWTQGKVTRTCFKSINAIRKLLCQFGSDVFSNVGDSGSPIFQILDPIPAGDAAGNATQVRVRLKGLLWGGPSNSDGSPNKNITYFSPLAGVFQDLGPLTVMGGGSNSTPTATKPATVTPPATIPTTPKETPTPGTPVGVSCTDLYLDLAPTNNVGTAPGPEDLPVASALSRTEPSATPSLLDVTTVLYQGPDLITGDENFVLDAVPDIGPTIDTCLVARANGQSGKEKMHQRTAFVNQFGNRPQAHASTIVGTFDPTNSEDGAGSNTCFDNIDNAPDGLVDAGDPDCYDAGTTTYIHFSTCTFSEVLGVWQRTESTTAITDMTANAINYGRVTLYVAAGAPTSGPAPNKANEALDPTTCAVAGSLPFASVSASYARSLADDWDGDGCPDWNELDHQFTHSFTSPNSANQHGMDPYNPNDCDENFTGNVGLFVTVAHDTSPCNLGQLLTEGGGAGACAPGGSPGNPNGQYFFCRTSVTHTKGPDVSGVPGLQEAVNWISGCYSDSTVQVVNASYFAEAGANCTNNTDNDGDGFINDGCPKVGATSETGAQCASGNAVNDDPGDDSVVNDGCPGKPDACPAPPATQDHCGDGRAGPRPPGGSVRSSPQSFLAIDDDTYPVPFLGVYDHQDNRLKFDICLIGFGGSFFGPNVHATGDIDGHTGAGLMQLYGGLTTPDCSGVPTLTLANNQVEMVELGQNVDSDHDGCTDNQELGSDVAGGGKRDVFNKWDYFNPSLNNTNRTKDITAVVQHFGHDANPPGDPLYKQRYDRGGSVPGSHSWNFLPPNGTIRTADITAAVNSFAHDCVAKVPAPFTT